jgi:hypothetical protein
MPRLFRKKDDVPKRRFGSARVKDPCAQMSACCFQAAASIKVSPEALEELLIESDFGV